MVQVRYNVFETNSSSTHSLVIMTNEEWKKVKKGELFIDVFAAEKGKTKLISEEKFYKEARKEYEEEAKYRSRWDQEPWEDKMARLKANNSEALKDKDLNVFGVTGERFINTKSGVWHNHKIKKLENDKVQVEFEHFFG